MAYQQGGYPQQGYQQQGGGGHQDNGCSVFVGNISYQSREEDLRQLFETNVGPVARFRLITDKQTGRSKGYGFCEFQSPESVNLAIEKLDGYDLNGRQLRVAPSHK
jgi:cleavage stimulation factor subunit 2